MRWSPSCRAWSRTRRRIRCSGLASSMRPGRSTIGSSSRPTQTEEAFDLAARPSIAERDYLASVDRALGYIRAGDIYQINFTFQAQLGAVPDPQALYAVLRQRQAARHGALLATDSETIACLSPELFFDLRAGRITTRPMKGTAARSDDPARDREAAARLAQDAKNRAENLMIVDLMRNDVTRIAVPGSVRVDRLFEIESYPTLHQMTSTVSAQLRDGPGCGRCYRGAVSLRIDHRRTEDPGDGTDRTDRGRRRGASIPAASAGYRPMATRGSTWRSEPW